MIPCVLKDHYGKLLQDGDRLSGSYEKGKIKKKNVNHITTSCLQMTAILFFISKPRPKYILPFPNFGAIKNW